MDSFAPHAARDTIAGITVLADAAAAAGARFEAEDAGLQTRRARTRVTSPAVRISSRFDGPTHHGLPMCHPLVRSS